MVVRTAPPPEPAPFVPEPDDEAAIPRPIGVPSGHELAASTSATPPPRKRRLGKLEFAIIGFLGFSLLLFAAWRLLGGSDEADTQVAARDDSPSPSKASDTPVVAPEGTRDGAPDSEPEPEPEPASNGETPSANPELDAALAPHLPKPDSPGPVRPMAQALSDQDFREAMVAAREEIVQRCLDSRMRRTLKISLVVKPSGGVEYARVVGSLAETKLGKCVVKRVYNIMFPPTHTGGSHTYTLRLR